MYRKICYKLYWFVENVICPGLKFSQYLYEDKLLTLTNETSCWIDLGCGRKLLPDWRYDSECKLVARCKSIVGIDLDESSIGKHRSIKNVKLGNILNIPFEGEQFDIATCNMVLEHVEDPGKFFHEVFRVLRPGGIFVFHTPNLNSYTTAAARLIPEKLKSFIARLLQGRDDCDLFRTFYKCNTSQDIKKYSSEAGFELIELKFWCCSAQFIVIPPLVLFELLYMRFLMSRNGKINRNNIFAVLRKPEMKSMKLTSY